MQNWGQLLELRHKRRGVGVHFPSPPPSRSKPCQPPLTTHPRPLSHHTLLTFFTTTHYSPSSSPHTTRPSKPCQPPLTTRPPHHHHTLLTSGHFHHYTLLTPPHHYTLLPLLTTTHYLPLQFSYSLLVLFLCLPHYISLPLCKIRVPLFVLYMNIV